MAEGEAQFSEEDIGEIQDSKDINEVVSSDDAFRNENSVQKSDNDYRYSLEEALKEAEELRKIIDDPNFVYKTHVINEDGSGYTKREKPDDKHGTKSYHEAERQYEDKLDPATAFSTDYYWLNYRTDIEPYVKGVRVMGRGQNNEIRHIGLDFFRSLLDPEKRISEEERGLILERATPIFQTRNLLFHMTPAERVPVIARVGILSRLLVNRYFSKEHKAGRPPTGSGWGQPFFGDDLIDVWDPAHVYGENDTHLIGHSREAKDGMRRDRFVRIPQSEAHLDYEVDSDYQGKFLHEPNGIHGGSMFVVRLKNADSLIRFTDSKNHHPENWSYVKYGIKPSELIGVVIGDDGLLRIDRLLTMLEQTKQGRRPLYEPLKEKRKNRPQYGYEWDATRSREEILDILGKNIEMPIYDPEGNLIWPEFVSADELLQRVLNKKETEDKQEKK